MSKKLRENLYKQNQVFNDQAKIVQKYFRGYYSRKYEHDFYARKRWLEDMYKKNEEVCRQLEEYVTA